MAGQRLSAREYCLLAKDYVVNCRRDYSHLPAPPAFYGSVRGKSSGELLAYLYFDAAAEEWVVFPPEDATEAVRAMFA